MDDPTRYDPRGMSPQNNLEATELRWAAERMAKMLDKAPGRCANIALTHLQTAVLFGVRAIEEQG